MLKDKSRVDVVLRSIPFKQLSQNNHNTKHQNEYFVRIAKVGVEVKH
jgi:hypothetical protein